MVCWVGCNHLISQQTFINANKPTRVCLVGLWFSPEKHFVEGSYFSDSYKYPVPRTLTIRSERDGNNSNLCRSLLTNGRNISGASRCDVSYPCTSKTNSRCE